MSSVTSGAAHHADADTGEIMLSIHQLRTADLRMTSRQRTFKQTHNGKRGEEADHVFSCRLALAMMKREWAVNGQTMVPESVVKAVREVLNTTKNFSLIPSHENARNSMLDGRIEKFLSGKRTIPLVIEEVERLRSARAVVSALKFPGDWGKVFGGALGSIVDDTIRVALAEIIALAQVIKTCQEMIADEPEKSNKDTEGEKKHDI